MITIKARQHTPPSPGQALIPLSVGLLASDGSDLPLVLKGHESAPPATTLVLKLDQEEASFTFVSIPFKPVPSILRDFSAPVKVTIEGQTDENLLFLFAHDSDPFNRWESGQKLLKKLILKLYASVSASSASSEKEIESKCIEAGGVNDTLASAFKNIILDATIDGTFKAFALSIPSSSELLDQIPNADPVLLYRVRSFITKQLSSRLRPELEGLIKADDDATGTPYAFNSIATARRAARNKALSMLSSLELPETTLIALARYKASANMTDAMAALGALAEVQGPERKEALDLFYEKWKNELVVLKWLNLQASSNAPGNLSLVKSLVDHPVFNITNPNNCHSLFLAFASSPVNFHAADGSGYQFHADMTLKVDKINHQVASRMVSAFTTFRQFDTKRQEMIKAQLERIKNEPGLSENVMEIVAKSLV